MPNLLFSPTPGRLPLLEAPRDENERLQFERWCASTMGWYAPRVGLGVVLALLLWWPSDVLIYAGQPELQAQMAKARLATGCFLAAASLGVPRLEVARRHPLHFGIPITTIATGLTSYNLAQMEDGNAFWLAYFYIAPLFSVAFLQPLGGRLLSSLAVGAAAAAGYLLAPGDAFASPDTPAALSYLTFACLMAAGLGHAVYLLVRSSFLMRLRVEEQRANLAELAGRLESRVAEQTSELRQLHRRSQEVGAEQRRLIARDLHDGLGQELSSLRLLVGLGQSLAREDAPRELFVELEGLIGRVQLSLRRVLQSLSPRLLDEQGLVDGLRALLAETERRWGLPYTLDIGALPDPLPAPISVAIFLISQEAIHNVVRHAHASALTLRLHHRDRALILEVQDNGRGMGAGTSSGRGLTNIRERAAELGGQATWEVRMGTLLRVQLPLEQP